nr:unnamed protein product [Digitaria exilis]
MAALLIVNRLFEKVPTGPLLLGWLLLIAAAVFLKYFAFICELGIVVACRERNVEATTTEYLKLASEELIGA